MTTQIDAVLETAQDSSSDLHHEITKIKDEPLMTKALQRKIAKIGLVASMGILTLTGFTGMHRQSKYAHTVAGVALIGLSIWHRSLYKTAKKKVKKEEKKD